MYNLRKATIKDAQLLFGWTNEEEVRAGAIIKKRIEWDEHIHWLKGKLQNSQSYIYILTDDKNTDIGVVRFDKDDDFFNISYSIDKKNRKKGMGLLILQLGIHIILETEPHCNFKASVQIDNIASNKIFGKLGFQLVKTEVMNEYVFNVYCKDGN